MTITVNYQKRKNNNLFNKLKTNKNLTIDKVQNYIPIYERFFSLNSTNFNSINLNNLWSIYDIKESKTKDDSDNIFTCKLKNILDEDALHITQKVFFKMAPLLDPYKYLVGKYNHNDPNLFNLPSFDNTNQNNVHPKILEKNNSSYVDSFFSFLTSQTLYQHNFIHGLDFYGSFIGLKNNYKLNIIDDLDYLVHSDFFNKQKGKLFEVEDYSYLINETADIPLKPIKISSAKTNISIKSFDDNEYNGLFNQNHVTLSDVQTLGLDLEDVTNSNIFELNNNTNYSKNDSETLKSGSSCSSRTSHTNDDDDNDNENEMDIDVDIDNTNDDDEMDIAIDNTNNETLDNTSYNGSKNSDFGSKQEEIDSDSDYETICEDETLFATIPSFPVQIICLECCENTFDSLIINEELKDEEWFAALMQIIMILISYQKMFSFTHNDLHTNNIMYVSTNRKYIYYKYKKQIYKVPTYGKIFKIIDFGRAIYKFNGKIFCSDSFQHGNDAATQYNTEPYYNDKKPRLEPNFSFDLCRLACSIFDYVVNDFEILKNLDTCSSITRLIVEWCIDDNGINVLYKNSGVERYPDFKLYKMIARHVHKHTPVAQLERKEFKKFAVNGKNIDKLENELVIDIDLLPSYCNQ